MKDVEYLGLPCAELSNGIVTLRVPQTVGPRVISLQVGDSENLFAELATETLECPGKGSYHFYGGHRLWVAPENPALTHLPDDEPVEILPVDCGMRVRQRAEPENGIQKDITLLLDRSLPGVHVEHTLTNAGASPITCAAWAITQFRPGGVAVLPQSTGPKGGNPMLPNRSLALWPYTDVCCRHVHWGNEAICVFAGMSQGRFKIGFPNPRGWLAYWQGGVLFVKRVRYFAQAMYCDFGSSSECYCDPRFIELETLSPLVTIPPGGSVHHKEEWLVHPGVEWPQELSDIAEFVEME